MSRGPAAEGEADPLAQAAEWFALLNAEEATAGDRRRWREWLQASAANRRAWRQVEAIDRRFRAVADAPAREALAAAGGNRRRVLKGLAAAALAIPAGALLWQRLPVDAWRADLRTATGEIRDAALPEGGRIWLNTGTAVNVAYGPAARGIELLSGEIHVETVPDPRPLTVTTAAGRIRPLGTRFTVRLDDGHTRVAVAAGRVALTPKQADLQTRVEAGEARRFDAQGVGPVEAVTAADAAWRRGLLIADDLALGEFLDELARYRHGVIRYDAAAARQRLVGAYPLADTDRILAAVERSLPVTVTRLTPWWVEVRGR